MTFCKLLKFKKSDKFVLIIIVVLVLLFCVSWFSQQHAHHSLEFFSAAPTPSEFSGTQPYSTVPENKLDCVLTACNENELYSDLVPMFIKSWNILYPNIDVKIIFIAETIPEKFRKYRKNLILFKPIKNISTAFTSQYIRLLYPAILNYENGIMITDIDNIPMNMTFFTENIKHISKDKWINLRDWKTNNEISMCWQIATSKMWAEVFHIYSLKDITNRLISVYSNIKYIDGHGQNGWETDQTDLYKYVMKWNKKMNKYIYLNDSKTGFNRLDRTESCLMTNELRNQILSGKYSDCHACRPYKSHKGFNDNIIELLTQRK